MRVRQVLTAPRQVKRPPLATAGKCLAVASLATVLGLIVGSRQVSAVSITFDTELVELNLSGGPFPMPLASDPLNQLGDSINGYGFVNSQVDVTLSSQRAIPGPPSLGQALASNDPAGTQGSPDPIDPAQLDGQQFFVDSFFDVFFDITVTDVDNRAGRDYAGQPDGAAIPLEDNGPAKMQSHADGIFFDASKPDENYGLIPPPNDAPYIGHFLIEIPLGGDINGNGENDKIKFTLVTHAVEDGTHSFIQLPDGTVLDTFDSAAFLEGAIVDESTDPPFAIGALLPNGLPDPAAFGGPTTASALLQNDVIPEPSSLTLCICGLAAVLGVGWRRRRKEG